MPSSHLILCHPLLLLPPIPPSIRVFSNQSTLHMRWPKYWSLSFSISPSNEHPGLISFRMDWLDLLASVRSIHFCPLLCPSLHEMFPWISNFLEEISSLIHSIIFLYFFELITEEGFLSLLAIFWNSEFGGIYLSFSPLPLAFVLFSAICMASSDNNFAFLHFFSWEWS